MGFAMASTSVPGTSRRGEVGQIVAVAPHAGSIIQNGGSTVPYGQVEKLIHGLSA